MSYFRIGKIEFQYDTLVGIVTVVVMMFFCTVVINNRLVLNADKAASRDSTNKEVLETIVTKLSDEQQVAKELAEITNKNKELQVKLENNFEQLQECKVAIEKRTRAN